MKPVIAESPDTPNPGRFSWSFYLAWAVVIAMTLFLTATVAISQLTPKSTVGGDASSIDLIQIQLAGRSLVGQDNAPKAMGAPNADQKNTPPQIPASLDKGTYEQRLCYSILINEFKGPAEAESYLEELDEKVHDRELVLTPNQERLRSTLGDLYLQYNEGDLDSDQLPASDREFLKEKLEWIGELALVPAGTPQSEDRIKLVSGAVRSIITMGVAVLIGVLTVLIGIVLAITLIVLVACQKLKPRFLHDSYHGSVYIETFALWMVLFFATLLGIGSLDISNPRLLFALQPTAFFASLLVLAWPVVRGIPFSQVKQDIGWAADRPVTEVLIAIPAYLATLPLLVPGIILAVVLSRVFTLFQPDHEFARKFTPGHPIQEYIMSGDFTVIALVFLTACVAAPIVEETMFRGVLYRHLRDLTGNWQRWLSLSVSAIVNGLIFASIHPQGIVAVPVLASLAFCFSLTREWRSSLIGPMSMHAIHNALITCISLLIL